MNRLSIKEQTIKHWEVDILAKLERAKKVYVRGGIAYFKSNNNRTVQLLSGQDNCPLCERYHRWDGCYSKVHTPRTCPLVINNIETCKATPFPLFVKAIGTGNLPSAIKEARNMIAFMKNRFKEVGLVKYYDSR